MEFLRASIADLITLFFSSLQNSEGGGDSDSGDSFADPCQFGKKLADTKIVARVNGKSKKIEKRLLNRKR